MYWSRSSAAERATRSVEILQTLREHHHDTSAPSAHPRQGFHLPEWDGDMRLSAAALIGGAPRGLVR